MFGDLRLDGLQKIKYNVYKEPMPIYVSENSGEGIFVITTEVINMLKNFSHAKIIMAEGICNCTSRNNVHKKLRFIFYLAG